MHLFGHNLDHDYYFELLSEERASFGPNGAPTAAAKGMLPFNPTGKPIPGVLAGSKTLAFMWGVAYKPPKPSIQRH
jgi:hypothetical protein